MSVFCHVIVDCNEWCVQQSLEHMNGRSIVTGCSNAPVKTDNTHP